MVEESTACSILGRPLAPLLKNCAQMQEETVEMTVSGNIC